MSSHAAALHGICPVVLYVQLSAAGIVSDVCPMSCICTGIGAAASVFLVCLAGILFMHRNRCGCFTPRGGGQRDRERFANLSLSLQHLSTHSGVAAAAGLIIANRVVYTNMICAIPVQVAHRHFDISCSYLCSGWNRLRFSRDVWLISLVFHLC